MKLRELAVIAGAAVLMYACSGRDEDVPPDAAAGGTDSATGSMPTLAPPPDTTSVVQPDTATPPSPARNRRDSVRRDTSTAPPGRNPPVGDPAPLPRPPVRLPRGDSA